MIAFRTALLLVLLILSPLTAVAQTVDSTDTLEQALATVASFEHGQSSEHLVAIEKFVFSLPPDSPIRVDVEQKLIDALGTAKTTDAKRFLCTQLRVVGTAKCVPAVAQLLADAEVSHSAVYCLGRMEVSEAGEALHEALSQTSGDIQAGILNALGDRRDKKALAQYSTLLKSDDATVAKAAARALGRLGTVDAAAVLLDAQKTPKAAVKTEIENALLCAAELLTTEPPSKALHIYTLFAAPSASEPLRFAALRGMVQTTEAPVAAEVLAKAITSDNPKQRRFAISLIALVDGSAATERFASTVASLDAEDRVILLRALGTRADAAAAPALISASQSEDEAVRIAALEALGSAGDAESLQALATAAATYQGLAQKVARASLVKLGGDAVDAQLLKLADRSGPSVRTEAIRALAGRGANNAVAILLDAARDSEGSVRSAAIEALGSLAGADHLPTMVALIVAPVAAEDRGALADAMGKLFFRMEDVPARSKPVLDAYESTSPEAQAALLGILAKSASPEALGKVRSVLNSSDSTVRGAAVHALSDWPDASALGALLEFVGSTTDDADKETALQGYVRLAEISEDPTAAYLRVLEHVTSVNDRKRVLEGLGLNADSTEALALARKFVEDEALQATAGLAALRIAHRLRSSHEELARETLYEVIAKVDHDDVRLRAQEVLNDLDKYEDHILQWVAVGPFQEKGKEGEAIYNTVFPPEQGDAEGIEWKPITKGIGRWDINLESTFGGIDYCAAYVRTRVWSPKAQDALLEMGSDDALRAWLNGELVYKKWQTSGAAPRQHRAEVKLNEGWNDLMLKVVDHAGGWVFAARLRTPEGLKLEGLKVEAE